MALGQGTCSCLLSARMTVASVVSRTETHYLHFKCSVWSKSKTNQTLKTTVKIHFFWKGCLILSPSLDLMGGGEDGGGGNEEEKKTASNLLFMFGCLCVCFVFGTNSSMHFWKSQTNLWPGCCEWSLTPTVLWKQTQAQGQVLLLFQKFFPTSSILPLALISTALIWDLLSQLVKELFNYDFLTILRRKKWKEKGRKRGRNEVTNLPLPPVACSIFKWSTVIWSISAFSNFADPWINK